MEFELTNLGKHLNGKEVNVYIVYPDNKNNHTTNGEFNTIIHNKITKNSTIHLINFNGVTKHSISFDIIDKIEVYYKDEIEKILKQLKIRGICDIYREILKYVPAYSEINVNHLTNY
tara:strand:- start:107 stop:457 length:351 start_codon:yes stop_codon:yes gene_type:complete